MTLNGGETLKRNIKLDQFQEQAVFTKQRNTVVVAAPGSGKTTVIINRVAHLVEDMRIHTTQIIVITFTKAAALHMKERYSKLTGSDSIPFFGTFHGLFYRILRKNNLDFQMIESNQSYQIIQKVLTTYLDEVSEDKVKEVIHAISIYKNSGSDLQSFEPAIDKGVFIQCLRTYEGYKKERGLLDFDDLQLICRDLFIKNPRILQEYQKKFKHILVDEFQDCDTTQIEILKMLNKENSVFAVGDEDQCIYGFRGSRPDCMVHFDEHFEKAQKIYLSYNYRSPENIINVSKEIISNNIMRNNKNIIPWRKDHQGFRIIHCIDENHQCEEICRSIETMAVSEKSKYSDHAVLFRTNLESRSIIDSFIRKKIPFKLLDKEYNFFDHFICIDLIAYLWLSIQPSDKESFLRIINKPFRYISRLNLESIRNNPLKENCFELLAEIESLPVFQLKAIQTLKKDIAYLNKLSLPNAIEFIIYQLGYFDYLKEYSNKFKIDLQELEYVLDEFKEAASSYKNILPFLNHTEEVKDEIKKSKEKTVDEAVILSTIHGVKGMEFKNVYIINCNEENIPHINSIEKHLEEERRIFYVAVTRTIDNLTLLSVKRIRGKAREVSRFLKECGSAVEDVSILPYQVGDNVYHRSFGEGKIAALEKDDVDILFKDGLTRKFDIVVLMHQGLMKKLS